jgi:hypothetical protein
LLQLKQRPEMNSLHDLLGLGYSQLERALRQLGEKRLADEVALKAEQEREAARSAP